MDTPIPNSLTGVIPERLLVDPLPNDAYLAAFWQLVRVTAPLAIGASLALIGAVWTFSMGAQWVGAVLLVLGAFLIGAVVSAVFVYEDMRADYRAKRNAHTQVMAYVGIAIQNLTINNVTVGKARQVNVGGEGEIYAGDGNAANTGEVIDSINVTYDVAVLCMNLAINAWMKNGGKRPRPKPFAFDAVTKELETGHDRWNAALQMLHDAQVIHNGTEPSWRVLVDTPQAGAQRLDAHLRQLGYFTVNDWRNGKTVWQRALPSPQRRGQ